MIELDLKTKIYTDNKTSRTCVKSVKTTMMEMLMLARRRDSGPGPRTGEQKVQLTVYLGNMDGKNELVCSFDFSCAP